MESYEIDKFVVEHKMVKCIGDTFIYQIDPINYGSSDIFQISENGTLLNELGALLAPPGHFCLERDALVNYQLLPLVCQSEEPLEELANNKFIALLHLIALIVSVPFLVLTFLVYALIEKLQNLHGKCLTCHVLSLLVAYICLIIVGFTNVTVNSAFCVILGK